MISLEVRHFAVFPITISAPDFCASSNSFCSTPCGRKSSASKKNRYFPSAFCNPQFLAPAPPRFSSSITTSSGYRFSYSLKISAELSVEPSLTQITSKSCVNFCPQTESKHLLRVPAALYTGIITDTAQPPRNVNSSHSAFSHGLLCQKCSNNNPFSRWILGTLRHHSPRSAKIFVVSDNGLYPAASL